MRVEIRVLEESDIGQVASIIRGLPEWFTPQAHEQVARDATRMHGYVAIHQGRVVGFILLEERECCMEIAWMAVERGHHGRGIGRRLIEEAAGYACRRGKRVLTVKTYGGGDYEPYQKTLSFYKSTGFKLYEIIDNYTGFQGQPAAVLIKPLDCAVLQ